MFLVEGINFLITVKKLGVLSIVPPSKYLSNKMHRMSVYFIENLTGNLFVQRYFHAVYHHSLNNLKKAHFGELSPP